MADHKRWFKVWTTILSDDDFDPHEADALAHIGRWTLLGAHIALHGENGQVSIRTSKLLAMMQIKDIAELRTISVFKNVVFGEDESDNARIRVSYKNWCKFQKDYNAYLRVKRYRQKQRNDNAVRGDEKRRDKKRKITTIPQAEEGYKIKTPLQYIVCSYKSLIGVRTDDRGWDTHNFKRSSKAAKSILEAFDGKHRDAAAWMKTKAEEFNTKGISWTLETLARWAWDTKGDRNENDYSQVDASTET